MSGGDLIRHPGAGDLLRSRELLTVGELSAPESGSPPIGLSSNRRSYNSPIRSDSNRMMFGMDEVDISNEVGSGYRGIGESPRIQRHLMSGRDSIL